MQSHPPDTGPWILLCALAVVALLVAERRHSQRGKWIAKPLASAAFVATAVAAGALDGSYGRLILTGLVLCLVGDVLLIPQGRTSIFRAGVLAFLSGHLAFAAAFVTRPLDVAWLLGAGAALVAVLWSVWRWLRPALPADMRNAVLAYLVVIGTMSSLAVSLTGAGGPATVAAGALAFTASDVSVARDRFVREDFANRAWGLPLYYCAQLLLALSAAAIG
jgi:uncharacterized membrane protein YhhN